jgi:hypothetical protein
MLTYELRRELLPALKNVFDQALSGGGARGINFNELAGDLAQVSRMLTYADVC